MPGSDTSPLVGIVMGSDSDLPVVSKAIGVLEDLGIAFEVNILSAHRTPDEAVAWVRAAKDRGIKVIIAAAGLAAHLPGVLASHTTLPVIGLPIAGGPLQGVDALYSIVQMPGGIPVAAVGLSNGKNAGLIAAQILAAFDEELQTKIVKYRQEQADEVLSKQRRLQQVGWQQYLSEVK